LVGGIIFLIILFSYFHVKSSDRVSKGERRMMFIFIVVNLILISLVLFLMIYPELLLIEQNIGFFILAISLVITNGLIGILFGIGKYKERLIKSEDEENI
jgi:membrane protein CcdC involved in cytochrome C biogenesis